MAFAPKKSPHKQVRTERFVGELFSRRYLFFDDVNIIGKCGRQ
jgi:hypothetical protein